MRGCLTLPFRLAALVVLIAAGFLVWSYRREIRRQIHQWTSERDTVSAVGQGDPDRAPSVRRRMQSLRPGSRDSVVLTARDVAALLAEAANREVPGTLDSIEVRLDDDDVALRALVDTRRLELGAIRRMVRDHEWVDAGGAAVFRRASVGEWRVERARLRGIPLPGNLVEGAVNRISGGAGGRVEVPLPATVGGLRVSRRGVVLYGTGPAGRGTP